MGNKLPENIKQKCQEYGQNEKDILGLIDHLNDKGYQCLDIIGKGGYGVVLRAFSKKLQSDVAIKCLKVEKKNDFEKLKKECEIIQRFKETKYLLKCFDTFQVVTKELSLIFMVTEICQGDLSALISSEKKLNKLEILRIFVQLLLGLVEMENHETLHLDIKPPNILFKKQQGHYQVKYADFGLSKNISHEKGYTTHITNEGGTYVYISEEVLNENKHYSFKTDIYSLGVVFVELLIGRKIKKDEAAFLRKDGINEVQSNEINDEYLVDNVIKKMVVKHDMRETSQQLLYKISDLLLNLEFENIPKLIQIDYIMKIEQYKLLIQDIYQVIGQDGAMKVSDALSKFSNITQLNLQLERSNIDENRAKSISDVLKNCKSMIQLELNLDSNGIGSDGAKEISGALRNCPNITQLTLNLSWNNIGDDGAKSVANAIQNCKQITYLDLGLRYNNIDHDGAKSVANAIQNCQQITSLTLDLRNNKIGDDGAKSVANAILNCQQITVLKLSLYDNNISQGQKQLLVNSLRSKFGGINPIIYFD